MSDHEKPLRDPKFMLWTRERLTPLCLAPIGLRGGTPLASAALCSPRLRLRGHLRRGRPSPVEDHFHAGVRLEILA